MSIPAVSDNERLVLDVIRRQEPIARSLIHSQTPFTQPSVHRILDGLNNKRLVTVGNAKINGPGKPSPEIKLNRSDYYSVGIVVNTDAITVCLANLACELVGEVSFEGQSHNRDLALQRIQQEIHHMLAQVGATESDLAGICLSIAAYFIGKENQVNASIPLQEWSLIDLGAVLSHYFHAPISVENNATTGAIGESLVGVGRWANTFVYLSFNYGFGGGVIIEGKPFYGAHGNALEISMIYDDESGSKRPALGLLLQHLNEHGVDVQTMAELGTKFDPNWPGVAEWVEETLPQLNRAIWAVCATIDPQVIVFGGQIPKALADIFIERVSIYSSSNFRYGVPIPTPKLVYTEAPNVGAALGAAMKPLKTQFFL